MHRKLFIASILGLAFASNAMANDDGPFAFEFFAPGREIPDDSVNFIPLSMTPSNIGISFLELEIVGLTHDNPGDLNIFLVDPFGNALEVMDDAGDMVAIEDVNLRFNDKAEDSLPMASEIMSGLYKPQGPGSFAQFTNGGTNSWLLVVIDDEPDSEFGGPGSFDGYYLRVVPEPMTLSLLALGALAGLRRKRR